MGFFRSKPKTFRQDLRAARKSATRTAFIVVLLVSGVVPAFTFLWGSSAETASSLTDQLSPLWKTFLYTYPLTLSVALITYSRKQKWFRFGKWFFAAIVMVGGAAVSNAVAQWTGHAVVEQASILGEYENPLFGIPAAGINYFFGFYQSYGFAPFLASILVGMFAGSTASRLGRHVPKNIRSSAKGLVRDLVEQQKEAA